MKISLTRAAAMLPVLLALLLAQSWAGPSDDKPQPQVRAEMLTSTQWLADHLNDPNLVVLHVAKDRAEYEKGHIPGARLLAFEDFMVGHKGLMDELPSVERLKQAFEKVGIGDNTKVVIYTSNWYPMAGRAYYTLDYMGHGDKTSLLNGGINQWDAEKRPIAKGKEQEAQGAVAKVTFTPNVREKVRAVLGEVKAVPDDKAAKTVLVDSRPEKRYEDGHISGAAHVFWEETVADTKKPVFLSPEKLRALFESRGITPDRKAITYCEVGLQASHNYFVLKYLGYDDAMYDGSDYEWEEVEHLPVVKGSSAR
jgi:thiosulfate/3-mercaptopyruvate sulfurtransferase